MKVISLFLSIFFLSLLGFSDADSIFAAKSNNGKRLTKATPGSYVSALNNTSVERLQYRSYTILLNPINGQYEAQVHRMINYGGKQVNSIFASQFQTSVEYSYSYESASDRIRREHYLFPPNSLTGWANPNDYLTMREFAWREPFPSKTCRTEVHTSEEYGREYMEASCFASRDSAIKFAKKFIDYVLGNRGM